MNRLSVRIVISHVIVALVGGAVTFVVVRWTTPAIFDRTVMGMGMMNRGQNQLRDVVSGAVTTALLFGIGSAVAVAVVGSLTVTRRLLRPVDDVRMAARRIAGGDYSQTVPLPHDVELAALASDVNSLARKLEETETRRVRLLSEVAHEMRTPLTVLEGRLEGMADGVFETSPEALATLSGQVARLHRLSDDLSALSRVEEHRLELTWRTIDLTDVVDAALERFAAAAEASSVSMTAHHGERPVVVEGDEQRIAQVLDNLIRNAFRAMPEGGRLTVETRVSESLAAVAVTDTGRGLGAEDLERIFERFYRVPEPGRGISLDRGSGIGLTVSRGIAEAHGGTLVAQSAGPGQGATFVLTLPRTRPVERSGSPHSS